MKKIKGFILFIIAQITTPAFNIVGMVYSSLCFSSLKEANKYYGEIALSKDQHSNVVMQYLFNHIMIKTNGYRFGNEDETISSVFGKNQLKGTLTWFGMLWNNFLNNIDENHSVKSIEEDETND